MHKRAATEIPLSFTVPSKSIASTMGSVSHITPTKNVESKKMEKNTKLKVQTLDLTPLSYTKKYESFQQVSPILTERKTTTKRRTKK